MSALQSFMLVVDHDKEEAKRIAEGIAHDVETKKATLIDTVQSLGEYINDEDPILRGKAISYLTAVIKALSPKYLSRQQIQVLTTFFCDRIEDGGAVDGLQTLQGLDRFNKFLATQVAQALFSNFQDLQSRSQTQRFHVYQLLNDLMSNHRGAMRDMGEISLLGVVDIMTGEKDPRNLMIVFSILKVIMVEWDISNHVETLFDSVYNYFPITFRPPPNDPYGITAQDLKGRLQDCISSTRHFAPHAIPALLDKLDSTSPNVKKDALSTLIACIHSYDPDTVSKYSITIWEVLKFEILNAQEEFLSETSLEALQAIAQRLSEGVTEVSQELPLAKFLQPITKECNEQLQEPQSKKAKPAQSILSCVAAASPVSFILVVQTVVAPIFTLYQEADGIVKQRALLETLNVLFDAAITVFGQWTTRGGEAAIDNPLLEFKDQFSDLLGQALMGSAKEEVSFRVTALKGFLRLSTLRGFFQENEIGLFVQYLDEILLKEESVGRNDLKNEAIAALAEVSKHKPRLIVDITFPAFVATLPEEDDGSEALYLPTLETLAQISVERDIFETLFRRLFSKLSILLQKEQPGSVAYPRAILVTLLYVMQQRNMEQDQSVDLYFDKVVVGLCREVAASAFGKAKNRILNDPTVLDTLGRLCNLLVRSVSTQKQEQVAENVYSLFSAAEDFVPIPFTQTTNADQERTIIISTYLLAGLSKDCSDKIPHTNPDMSGLLLDLVHRSVSSTEPATHQAYLRHLALLVNKFLSKQDVTIAEKLFDSLLQGQDTESQSLDPATIRTIFWLSKALILRLAPTTTHIITSLLALLSSPDQQTSATAAQGFSIILGEDDILSATNGATIRLLCRQRLFTTVIPLISSRIREVNIAGADDSATAPKAPDHIKPAHLTALAGILSTIPTALVMPELPTLLPLLLQSLDLQTAGSVAVRTATLDTLAVIIRDNGVVVIDKCGHVQSLVTRLLKTTTTNIGPGAVNSPRLRADALKCLNLLATHQVPGAAANARAPPGISPLLPVKNQVLRSLRAVLDDPKRDVRKAAVDARAAWLRGVDDAPEEEE
ncbi:Armadillo-like helical [Penicillium griseofulvum]|uniref:MMS19 nucleotide excision repair protein n=1 Tax=Penicillium patulum TaxID=5078 RepID=A0A135LTA2_PENPA|nr:Armadillo-like helical [Penicillium griseofulvum]KXG52156.1 Armadillo-like helical [Penicillium griseofulvum]